MNENYNKLLKCFNKIREITDFEPDVALVLGTGLGGFAEKIEVLQTISYSEIDGFPISTVKGHSGRFILGLIDKTIKVIIMQGRVHYYEGYSMSDVVLPIRIMRLMGAKTLFLTNAAGGINDNFSEGDFMLISDQICNVPSPLIGQNFDELGTRFPDMTGIYDENLRKAVREVAVTNKIKLHEGVYVQLTGPQFETPAEIRMWDKLGVDAVGMSTACEAITAVHCGMKVVGISCITNVANKKIGAAADHSSIEKVADRNAANFETLVKQSIISFSK